MQDNNGKSSNPHNPDCSSCLQALLELRRAGFRDLITPELLEAIGADKAKLRKADTEFNAQQHPDSRTSFAQLGRDAIYSHKLSSSAMHVLCVLVQNMRKGNLLELSLADCMTATNLSKNTANKALQELQEKGCIAKQFERSKTHGTVYMVNPEIAVTGKNRRVEALQNIFWALTGDHMDENRDIVYSNPHTEWIVMKACPPFSRGHDRQDYGPSTYYFNKINEPRIAQFEKETPAGAGNTTAGDEQICNN